MIICTVFTSDAEVIVADNECTSTRPQTSKVCRERTTQQVECKHEWIVGQWTKVSQRIFTSIIIIIL